MGRVTGRRPTMRIDDGRVTRRADTLVVEEPLEIRVDGTPLSVTMRTPGHDVDLALGFLLTEGLITEPDQVRAARHCTDPGTVLRADTGSAQHRARTDAGQHSAGAGQHGTAVDAGQHGAYSGVADGRAGTGEDAYNVLQVSLAPGAPAPDPATARNFYTTSSCGVCGKASIDAVRTVGRYPVAADPVTVHPDVLTRLPERLRAAQRVFERTGGLHAAGLFDASEGGRMLVREDVGRHNAVDKVIGAAAREHRLPLRGQILMVSGRAGFELVQKASMAGVPIMAAVSAPSSLAVDLAEEVGLTLVGFLRGSRMNVYSRQDRIRPTDAAAPAG